MKHSFSTSPQIRKLSSQIATARKRNKCTKRLIAKIELERILFHVDQLPEHKFSRELVVDLLLDWKDGNALFRHPKARRKIN
jgi:hypothetical protein